MRERPSAQMLAREDTINDIISALVARADYDARIIGPMLEARCQAFRDGKHGSRDELLSFAGVLSGASARVAKVIAEVDGKTTP